MPNVCRLTDQGFGTCTGHTGSIDTGGIIISSSGNVFANGLGVAGINDTVLSFCGHVGIIITGSGTVFRNGISVARIGDLFSGTYSGVLITGSPNVFSG
jgi:uncharacterized Zn-binding protein involved in type VI secretion